jgi:hypothetical protein
MGQPADAPALVVSGGTQPTAAVSWNGATEVASWELLAGRTRTTLRRVAAQPRAGFETVLAVTDHGPWYAIRALDATGQTLGVSATVQSTD